MKKAVYSMTWKELAEEIMKEFFAWGCIFSRKNLPEIALDYDCDPLFFWNFLEDPEAPRTEKGFLRALGYAWRKYLQEECNAILPGKAGTGATATGADSFHREAA